MPSTKGQAYLSFEESGRAAQLHRASGRAVLGGCITSQCILRTRRLSSACNSSKQPTQSANQSIRKASPAVSICNGGHDSLCCVSQPVEAVLGRAQQIIHSPAAP